MAFRDHLLLLRDGFFVQVSNGFEFIATWFGYPTNPGMPLIGNSEYFSESFFQASPLPIRPLSQLPEMPSNLIEVFMGTVPQILPLERHFFQSTDGFYNFYIENYQNLLFLPNKLSEILQINFGYCLDITFLEVLREVLFIGLVFYGQVVSFRFILAWFLIINPYTLPWTYLIALVDWIEDTFLGIVPSVVGINLTGSVFLALLGKLTDSINHIVFTMPFLPSEGEPMKMFIDGELKDVLVFRYLPVLWYKYPIPNEIREFWYNERPDILAYMEIAYKNIDIRILPDRFFNVLEVNPMITKISSLTTSLSLFPNLNDIVPLNIIDIPEKFSHFY